MKKPAAKEFDRLEATEMLAKAAKITVEGREYKLVITNGCLIEFEQLTGISTITESEKILRNPSRHALIAMFYVLLKNAGASYLQSEVEQLVTAKNLPRVFETIAAAWSLSMAQEEERNDPIVPATAIKPR